MLDHVIALNEEHLRRIMRDYVNYHQQDRLHGTRKRTHRTGVQQSNGREPIPPSFRFHGWVRCTIAMRGDKPHRS
jgi:hypothetical protein